MKIKKRRTKSVQDHLFQNQLDQFDYKFIKLYYEYSEKLFPSDNSYTEWLLNFRRKYPDKKIPHHFLLTSYLENKIYSKEEEERFFHPLQFLSFIKTLSTDDGSRATSLLPLSFWVYKVFS